MFQSLDLYPELRLIEPHHETIRAEAIQSIAEMQNVSDERTGRGMWKVLPVLPEAEDRPLFAKDYLNRCEELASHTLLAVRAAVPVKGLAFSLLEGDGRIFPHRHYQNAVTASFCLECAGEAYMVVEGTRKDYREGEWILFDYRQTHEVVNLSESHRLVMLMLLENRGG